MSGGAAVQEQIRELIMSGVFVGGDRLVEDELAARLRVSRTPVRESLHALAACGLVKREARTWTVRALDVDDVREIFEIRWALESTAARLAATRRSAAQLRAIDDGNRATRAAIRGTSDDFGAAALLAHGLIADASGNRRLAHDIDRAQLSYATRPVIAMYTAREIEDVVAEHEAIASAIRERDPDAAEAAMRRHVEHSIELVVRKVVWLR